MFMISHNSSHATSLNFVDGEATYNKAEWRSYGIILVTKHHQTSK